MTGKMHDNISLVGEALDYTDKNNWMKYGYTTGSGKQKVDVFYLYPTSVDPNLKTITSEIDDAMKQASMISYLRGPDTFKEFTNIYAPYYRQLALEGLKQDLSGVGIVNSAMEEVTRTDVYAALDHFFEKCNEGRPFILASHSQGSALMFAVLVEYMKMPEHKDYLKRMVAAYTIGLTVNSRKVKEYGLKFAEGETDTGVIITWNSFKGEDIGKSMFIDPENLAINPINWKRDGTVAPKEMNLGSLVVDMKTKEMKMVVGKVGAKVLTDQPGAILAITDEPGFVVIPGGPFGKGSMHLDDWNMFYVNIRENAKKRIDAYFKKQ